MMKNLKKMLLIGLLMMGNGVLASSSSSSSSSSAGAFASVKTTADTSAAAKVACAAPAPAAAAAAMATSSSSSSSARTESSTELEYIVVPEDLCTAEKILKYIDARNPKNKIIYMGRNSYDRHALMYAGMEGLLPGLITRKVNVTALCSRSIRNKNILFKGVFKDYPASFQALCDLAEEQGCTVSDLIARDFSISLEERHIAAITDKYAKESDETEKTLEEILSAANIPGLFRLFNKDFNNRHVLAFKEAIQDFQDTQSEESLRNHENILFERLNEKRKIFGRISHVALIQADQLGYTPLLYAVYVNKLEAVKYLLKLIEKASVLEKERFKKSVFLAQTKDGYNAYTLAKVMGHTSIVECLEKYYSGEDCDMPKHNKKNNQTTSITL